MPIPNAKQEAPSVYAVGNIQSESRLIMTSKELLRQYIIGALNEENFPASGGRIKTWDDFPSELGKRPFNQNSLSFGQSW